jgi:TetR/AcrR family transcriptional regulator, regulator of biofilm formation and stress response
MTSIQRRARRHDPNRKERIVEKALEVLARDGVAGITHRAIGVAADVPLGSITYHFATLDDIVQSAFSAHVDKLSRRFEARLESCQDGDDLIECITAAITDDLAAHPNELAVTYELYGDAVRKPQTKRLTQQWMERAEDALAEHFDRATARLIDVVVEGLMVHMSIAQQPISKSEVRALLTMAASGARRDPARPDLSNDTPIEKE